MNDIKTVLHHLHHLLLSESLTFFLHHTTTTVADDTITTATRGDTIKVRGARESKGGRRCCNLEHLVLELGAFAIYFSSPIVTPR